MVTFKNWLFYRVIILTNNADILELLLVPLPCFKWFLNKTFFLPSIQGFIGVSIARPQVYDKSLA